TRRPGATSPQPLPRRRYLFHRGREHRPGGSRARGIRGARRSGRQVETNFAALMRLRWTTPAAEDLYRIVRHIQKDNPSAAAQVAKSLYEGCGWLEGFPYSGRKGRIDGTRELTFPGLPYIVVYRIEDQVVDVLRIFHGAQDWPLESPPFEKPRRVRVLYKMPRGELSGNSSRARRSLGEQTRSALAARLNRRGKKSESRRFAASGLKPSLILHDLRGAKAPLYHSAAGFRDF